jgi:hypothetical protein
VVTARCQLCGHQLSEYVQCTLPTPFLDDRVLVSHCTWCHWPAVRVADETFIGPLLPPLWKPLHKLSPSDLTLVINAADRVDEALRQRAKNIQLDRPAEFSLGDAEWEEAVVGELNRRGKIRKEYAQ